jgi:predicted dehydrogenase
VVVEKPIDVNLAAARSLVEGAAEAGVTLHVISQQRYNPGVQRAKALLDQGALGRVVLVQAAVPWSRSHDYYASASWRATWELDGGGAFMNQGVHYADLVCWLFGPPRVEAARCGALAHDIVVEDVALALLSFEDGALGALEASTVAYPGFPAVLRAHGTKGTIVLEDGALVRADFGLGTAAGEAGAGPVAGEEDLGGAGALAFPAGHRAQLEDISEAIKQGRASLVGGEDGCRALQFVLDVYAAAGWGPYG